MKKLILCLITFFFSYPIVASESYFDKKEREVVCVEPLPKFTLGEKSNPSRTQVQVLCKCIWGSFPDGGWERDTAIKARNNQKPNSRLGEFIPKFGESLKKCGGYQL